MTSSKLSLRITVFVAWQIIVLNPISSKKKQFSSINGDISNQNSAKYGVPQGSVLEPLLFLIYINDLNLAIKHCNFYQFADDTNLLHFSKSVNKLNKYINLDMKNLTDWLNANKIPLNIKKN